MVSSASVRVEQVSLTLGSRAVLREASWHAPTAAVTAVLGPNGAGKTTSMLLCEGLLRPDAGRVQVLGTDPADADAAARARVGVMIQGGGLPVMASAQALLDHVARLYATPWPPSELGELLGIDEFAATSVRRLSGGQRQRLALALALVGRPRLVFLDEPTAGVDIHGRDTIWDLIRGLRAGGTSVVLSTHVLEEAEALADHVVILDRGEVVASGSPEELTACEGESEVQLSGTLTDGTVAQLQRFADEHRLRLTRRERRGLREVFLSLTRGAS